MNHPYYSGAHLLWSNDRDLYYEEQLTRINILEPKSPTRAAKMVPTLPTKAKLPRVSQIRDILHSSKCNGDLQLLREQCIKMYCGAKTAQPSASSKLMKIASTSKGLKAVCKIQAFIRGSLQRLQYRILVLEDKLYRVERKRTRELERIERRKQQKKREWKKYQENANRKAALLTNAKDLVNLLKRQNKRLVKEKRDLKFKLKQLTMMDQQLQQSYGFHCRKLIHCELNLMVLQDQNAVLISMLGDYVQGVELVRQQLVQFSKKSVLDELLQKNRFRCC